MTVLSIQIIIAGCVLLGTVFGAPFHEIHHQMTPEERLKVFRTAGTDVPPYEVVEIEPTRIQKRDAHHGHNIKINAFGEKIEHYLTPLNDVFVTETTPIKTIRSIGNTGNVIVKKSPVTMKMISRYIFQEKSYGITLSVKSHGRRTEMNGIIGYKNWLVSPMPDRLRKSLNQNRSRRSVDREVEAEHENKSYHIVHQIPNTDGQNVTTPLLRIQRSSPSVQNTQNSNHKIAYPEILVLVEYSLFKLMNFDMNETVTYVVAFWNGVDMLFRDFNNPQIKINIATIAVAQDERALGYIQPIGYYEVDADQTLLRKAEWLYKNKDDVKFPLWSYDASLTMMGSYNLGERIDGHFTQNALGIAYAESICTWSDERKRAEKVGIFTDLGNYQAIRTAAHEFGHILGSYHDGDKTKNNSCESSVGAILSGTNPANYYSRYSHSFTKCSKASIRKHLNKITSDCVWAVPLLNGVKPLPRILPGKVISLEAQCSYAEGYTIPIVEEGMCRTLFCQDERGYKLSGNEPAADGSSCAKNKICLHGYCVDEKRVMNSTINKFANHY